MVINVEGESYRLKEKQRTGLARKPLKMLWPREVMRNYEVDVIEESIHLLVVEIQVSKRVSFGAPLRYLEAFDKSN